MTNEQSIAIFNKMIEAQKKEMYAHVNEVGARDEYLRLAGFVTFVIVWTASALLFFV